MKIGSRVYVSLLSRSKVAGEVATVIGISVRDGYKVRTDFDVVGYAQARHVSSIVGSDSPMTKAEKKSYQATVDSLGIKPVVERTFTPLVVDPTDLLCRAVRFDSPFHRSTLGWVSDQWVEDDVELLNVVHNGTFTVIPRSFITDVYTVIYKDGSRVGII